jgi:TctA family transporter
MDLIDGLALGWAGALAWPVLAAALAGCTVGTLVGVLPGLSVAATVALMLPLASPLGAVPALVMLAAVYFGAQYGGSTAAILASEPGEASAAATALDGHHLARQGRAGPALAIAALASFFAGCAGALVIAAIAPPITALGFRFGPSEYFSLMVLGLVGAVVLAPGSIVKAVGMIVVGLLLAQYDAHVPSAARPQAAALREGLGVPAIAIGMFALGEVVARLGRAAPPRPAAVPVSGRLWPTGADLREAAPSVLRGTALGALVGMLPGGGALLSSVVSYTVERALVRRPSRPFGQGALQGVAGPEAANNAGAQASLVPMLALGIPTNAVTALLIGTLVMHGVAPGPAVMGSHPGLFWTVIVSMWVGNALLLVLNLPLVALWARLLAAPYRLVFPAVVALAALSLTVAAAAPYGVYVGAAFGALGYVLHKLHCEPVPLLLGFVLAPAMEAHLRHALSLADGQWSVFATRPVSAGLLIAAAVMVGLGVVPALRRRRGRTLPDGASSF